MSSRPIAQDWVVDKWSDNLILNVWLQNILKYWNNEFKISKHINVHSSFKCQWLGQKYLRNFVSMYINTANHILVGSKNSKSKSHGPHLKDLPPTNNIIFWWENQWKISKPTILPIQTQYVYWQTGATIDRY